MSRKPAKYGSKEHHRRIGEAHRRRTGGAHVQGGSYRGKPGRWANLWKWRERHGAWKPSKTSVALKRRLRHARRAK